MCSLSIGRLGMDVQVAVFCRPIATVWAKSRYTVINTILYNTVYLHLAHFVFILKTS